MSSSSGRPDLSGDPEHPDTVGGLAQLYLGNILYSLEATAMTLDEQSKADDAAFYRGIARKLAEAHGRAKRAP